MALTPKPRASDFSGEIGAPRSLPPHVQAEIDSIAASLESAKQGHDDAWAARVEPMGRVLQGANQEHLLAVQELAGSVDSAIRERAAPHFSAVNKASDTMFRDLILAQEELRAAGVPMPNDIQAVRADLSDLTGGAIVSRLMGAPFETTSGANVSALDPAETMPPSDVLLPPPDPPPPAPPPEEPTQDKCCPAPCPPPDKGWIESQLCPGAKPYYGSYPSEMLADGSVFQDPFNLRFYYAGDCDVSGAVPYDPNAEINVITSILLQPPGVITPLPVVPPAPPVPPPPKPPDPPREPCPIEITVSPPPVNPPTPEPAPSVNDSWPTLLWDKADACERATELQRDARLRGIADYPKAQSGGSIASALFRFSTASLKTFIDGVWSGFDDATKDASYKAHAALTGDFFGGYTTLIQSMSFLSAEAVPDKDAAWDIGLQLAIVANAQTSTSFPIQYLAQSLQYVYQFANPQFIPDQGALDQMYLAQQISYQQWVCLTRANGNLPRLAEAHMLTKRNRPDASQVVDLWRRGHIKDEKARDDELAKVGYVDKKEMEALVELSRWIPNPPDTVRFMVRDVFDPRAVQVGDLDKDFETKFYGPGGKANPGPAAAYFKAFGLDEETAKLFWRAHWELPSPTQLYEMLHRLRPDRPEYNQWKAAYNTAPNQAEFLALNPEPPVVTFDDVRECLELDDKAPAWIDRLMAISYNPMTRTDAIGAFMANVMSAEELHHRLRDTGLDEPTAKRTVELQSALRARRVANVTGVWTVRKICNAYREGAINGVQADGLLLPLIPDPQQRASVISGTDTERQANVNRARLKALRRRFIQGYHTNAVAFAQLVAMGMAPPVAQQLVDLWDQEHRYPRREATAKMISEWVTQRILSADAAFTRLGNLGYSNEDATLIVHSALVKTVEKVGAEYRRAKQEIKTIISDQRAAQRAAERELTEREKELEKVIKKLEEERERIQKELESRA